MNYARQNQIAAPIPGGILVAGGHPGNLVSTATAEMFSPGYSQGSWKIVASMHTARRDFAACRLQNGKILVAGGHNDQGQGVLASAELYDPNANTWTLTGSLSTAREEHQMTCLADGRVLVTGGFNGLNIYASAEVYTPSTGTWSAAGSMPFAAHAHRQARLSDGRVLVVGGSSFSGTALSSSALWTPSSNTWSSTGIMSTPRAWHAVSVLYNGRVLAAGGFNGFGATNTAEIYNPSTGTWAVAAHLNTPRYSVSVANTTNGPVVVGGYNGSGLASAERYDAVRNVWSQYSLVNVSFDQTATSLFNWSVIVAGGNTGSGATTSTQNYTEPPSLLQ
jgi:N-acetylneuraminic acid mutarotase